MPSILTLAWNFANQTKLSMIFVNRKLSSCSEKKESVEMANNTSCLSRASKSNEEILS